MIGRRSLLAAPAIIGLSKAFDRAAEAASLAPFVPAPRSQIVATRGQLPINTAGASSYTRFETQLQFTFGPVPFSRMQLMYAGFVEFQGGESPNPNPFGIDAAVLYSVPGTGLKVYGTRFLGIQGAQVQAAAGLVLTDPLPIHFNGTGDANTCLVRTGYTCAAGGSVPAGNGLSTGSDKGAFSTSATSQVYQNTTFVTPSGGQTQTSFGPGPTAIIGVPQYATSAVVINGDSIAYGQGDANVGDGLGNIGWIARGLGGAVYANGSPMPYANISRSGSQISNNGRGQTPLSRGIYEFCSHVILERGTNDIPAFASGTSTASALTTMQAGWVEQAATIKAYGKKVIACPITPHTAGGNASIYVPNIADAFLPGGLRSQFNNWLLAGAAGYADGLINPNLILEDSGRYGFWSQTGYQTDDLHPTQAGHTAAAAVSLAWAKTLG